MSWDAATELPADFGGTVRLFPLPNLVMFPHVVQPLHIFEPRYVQMLEDALQGDGLIAMALLQPGWEDQYEADPPLFPVICLGRVISHSRLEDGRYNMLLMGLRRAAVVRELENDRLYRSATVTVLADLKPAQSAHRHSKLESELLRYFREQVARSPAGFQQFEQLASQQLPLGVLTDILSHSLDLGLATKQQLLSEWNIEKRAGMLLDRLRSLGDSISSTKQPTDSFPPFSEN